jgi:hypothetical protein
VKLSKLRRISSVRFYRTEFQDELNMMHLGDEDDEFCSVDRFGSIEPCLKILILIIN